MNEPLVPPSVPAALGPNDSHKAGVGPMPLSEAQQKAVDEYIREMTDAVIPEILRAVESRRVRANLTRQMPLKFGG
jgi:hypothetical protein